jgi:hypothetical protein
VFSVALSRRSGYFITGSHTVNLTIIPTKLIGVGVGIEKFLKADIDTDSDELLSIHFFSKEQQRRISSAQPYFSCACGIQRLSKS